MTMPMYVSPEQLMKDRADFARKGVARGRPVLVLAYDGGIAFITENPSSTLHKISEIYDRVAFAAVGKSNEFESLRVAGIRYADLRGYSYDRRDVNARGLAGAYAQTLGTIFTQESKPYEVEIAVAQVGQRGSDDQIYRLTYDGSVTEERGFVAMGGDSEALTDALREAWSPNRPVGEVLRLGADLLATRAHGAGAASGSDGDAVTRLAPEQFEVAVLDRARPRRTFRRLAGDLLAALLDPDDEIEDIPPGDDSGPGSRDTLSQNNPDAGAHGNPASTNPETQRDDD